MKKVYLTFDDGPSAQYTQELLKLLDKYDVKATFFVVGEFVAAYPDIVREELAKGHRVCLHGNRHISSWLMTKKVFEKDMDEALKNLKAIGIEPAFYRPPWGMTRSFSKTMAEERNMKLIKWDVMAEDWRATTTPEIIASKILSRTKDNSVICLHDGRGRNCAPERTIRALEIAIPRLLERDYNFEVLQ